MQRRTILKGGAALGFATMMGGKLAFAQGLEKVKVGFIYVGPIGDGGRFKGHGLGLKGQPGWQRSSIGQAGLG